MDIKDVIEEFGVKLGDFRKHFDATIASERELREELERKVNGQRFARDPAAAAALPAQTWIDTKTRLPVPVLRRGQPMSEERKELPSMGRVLRGIILGGRADDCKELEEERKALAITPDTSGGYTVPSALSSQWIDLLRSRMVLQQAGVMTVPMPAKQLSLARVVDDPATEWHGENASLTDGDPTFGAITLNAKTITCLVKFSLELAQDSANIEQVLQSTITSAIAQEIDSAGLVGVTVNAAAAPAGIFNLTDRNTVTSIGAPTTWDWLVDGMYELLVDNVPAEEVGAVIGHPAIWKKMAKLKTGLTNDNTPLVAPDAVRLLPKLWTTAAPLTGGTTAKAVIGKWDDMLFGIRKDITIQVLNQTFMGSNLQLAIVAYARCDFGVTRPSSFCTMEGITV